MTRALILTLGTALLVSACSPAATDTVATDTATPAATAEGAAPAPGGAPAASVTPRPVAARPAAPASAPAPADKALPAVSFREFTIPAGTTLTLRLTTPVASDTSRVEDAVGAEFVNAVRIDGEVVVPAGAQAAGLVTAVNESARVKGRAQMTLQFTSVRTGGSRYNMRTEPLSWTADATKGDDAVKIGIGAGAGAAIGGILGGKGGAAKGAAVGGAAGTGVVLATRGEEVRLPAGTEVTTTLRAPLTVRVSVS